jgi:hypothetical protein
VVPIVRGKAKLMLWTKKVIKFSLPNLLVSLDWSARTAFPMTPQEIGQLKLWRENGFPNDGRNWQNGGGNLCFLLYVVCNLIITPFFSRFKQGIKESRKNVFPKFLIRLITAAQ